MLPNLLYIKIKAQYKEAQFSTLKKNKISCISYAFYNVFKIKTKPKTQIKLILDGKLD